MKKSKTKLLGQFFLIQTLLGVCARTQLYNCRRLIDNNNYTVHIQTSNEINDAKLIQ